MMPRSIGTVVEGPAATRASALLNPQTRKAGPALRVTNAQAAAADMYLYTDIGEWGVTPMDVQRELAGITAKRINLHINSPGGEVFAGIAIYTMLRDHPATITTYVEGLAASAASFVALAGDRVLIAKPAYLMIHEAWGVVIGPAEDLRKQADLLDRLSDTIADIYANRAGGTRKRWRDAMAEETWYTADEAVRAGLAHGVTDGDGAANAADLTAYGFRKTPANLGGGGTPSNDHELDIDRERLRLAVAASELLGAGRSDDQLDIARARLQIAEAELNASAPRHRS